MHKTLATAESCTGGLLGALLTETPGASNYYLGGVIAYHNGVKRSLLGVPESVLRKYGAVSAESAERMARGVRKRFKADIGIAITGIAGPSGGTKEKPVGLVYIALAGSGVLRCERFLFSGTRSQVRNQAAGKALRWVKSVL